MTLQMLERCTGVWEEVHDPSNVFGDPLRSDQELGNILDLSGLISDIIDETDGT